MFNSCLLLKPQLFSYLFNFDYLAILGSHVTTNIRLVARSLEHEELSSTAKAEIESRSVT
jgi:hypothetical protein